VKNRIHLPFAAQHQDPCNVRREVCIIKLTGCRKTSTVRMRDLLLLGRKFGTMNNTGVPANDKKKC